LQTSLQKDWKIGLVLVRMGAYALGTAREKSCSIPRWEPDWYTRDTGGRLVFGRFRRHREKQMEEFLIRVCEHAREKLEPEAKSLDYLIYGGPGQLYLSCKKSVLPEPVQRAAAASAAGYTQAERATLAEAVQRHGQAV